MPEVSVREELRELLKDGETTPDEATNEFLETLTRDYIDALSLEELRGLLRPGIRSVAQEVLRQSTLKTEKETETKVQTVHSGVNGGGSEKSVSTSHAPEVNEDHSAGDQSAQDLYETYREQTGKLVFVSDETGYLRKGRWQPHHYEERNRYLREQIQGIQDTIDRNRRQKELLETFDVETLDELLDKADPETLEETAVEIWNGDHYPQGTTA
jgi:hypothetical protein